MGIQNTQMYEKAMKAIAKTRVTLEVLSYHATAPLEEAKQLNVRIFFLVYNCCVKHNISLEYRAFHSIRLTLVVKIMYSNV